MSILPAIENASLVARARAGDRNAFSDWFDSLRGSLKEQVRLRLVGRMLRRVDASDVVQELFLDADRRLPELEQSELPLDGWIRILLKQRLVDLQRRHIHAAKRSVLREQRIDRSGSKVANIAQWMVADVSSPSMHLQKVEAHAQVRSILADLPDVDCEVLVLRHFKNLTNAEVAAAIGISVNAASNRYVRALSHFRERLHAISAAG